MTKGLIAVVVAALIGLVGAIGLVRADQGTRGELAAVSGRVLVELHIEPIQPKVGDNRIIVHVNDLTTGRSILPMGVSLELMPDDAGGHGGHESGAPATDNGHKDAQDPAGAARESHDPSPGVSSAPAGNHDESVQQGGATDHTMMGHGAAPAQTLQPADSHSAPESGLQPASAPTAPQDVHQAARSHSSGAEAHGQASSRSAPREPLTVDLVATGQPGEYAGSVHLDQAGSWLVNVRVSGQGVDELLTFGLTVAPAGPNWLLLGGITAPFLLMAAVAVRRRRVASRRRACPQDAAGAGQLPAAPAVPASPNLLDNPIFRRVVMSRLYPGVFQYITVLVFAVVVYELLVGPALAHDNFGTAMTWVIWWPLIPLFFLLLGRFWCAICPFATLSDFVQKLVGGNRPVPRFLKKYGIWIIDALFVLITWADHTVGIVESPRGSGVLLMMIILGVVTVGTLFERRTWCRYLCFLGGLSGNYSRTGAAELRATPSICSNCKVQACYRGNEKAPGCPMFEFPRSMDNNARCNFCGYCVKSCPNGSIRITPRMPTRELWNLRKPKFEEAFLACVIMGVVFVQNITMLEAWKGILAWLEQALGTTSYFATFTATFAAMMAAPILALLLAGFLARLGNGRGTLLNFTLFGYALIPLDLAGHLAHNLFHLLAEGKSVLFTAVTMFGASAQGSPAVVDDATIQVLQYLLILLGTAGSLYTAYRLAHSRSANKRTAWASVVPVGVLIAVLGLVNLVLFYLPMEMRM